MFFSNKNKLILITAATILLLGHFAIFGSFIPNKNEQMGHDYSFYLPALLDGYFWYKTNGIWEIPWFTPSFCGGSLNYLNINNGYYTIPQLLTFLTDPLSAVRLTLFLFAGLGLCGFYLLLRNAFSASRHTALLGGGLFLFNGFYAHRMLIGHIFIHSFMLLPLITFFMLRPLPAGANAHRTRIIFDITIGGFLFAYMVVSGISSFMIPSIISIVIIGLIHGASQLFCYEPMFGYRLEAFPVKTLHPGPVLEENNGVLNIKNPACYVWPQANDCEPGDHFTKEQEKAAEAFVNYRPFPFQMPTAQIVANWVNALSLMAALIFLIASCLKAWLAFGRQKYILYFK